MMGVRVENNNGSIIIKVIITELCLQVVILVKPVVASVKAEWRE